MMINFLPWRQRQSRRRLRFWACVFAGTLMISLATMTSLRASCDADIRVSQRYLDADQSLQHELERRHEQWRELQTQYQQRQQALLLRAQTQAWQPALTSLAAAFPEQAWLSQLKYQQSTLALTGYAMTLPALSALAEALKKLPGFTFGPAGEMRQDSQGRWMFNFTLQRQQ